MSKNDNLKCTVRNLLLGIKKKMLPLWPQMLHSGVTFGV
jgi:hypothetical protein